MGFGAIAGSIAGAKKIYDMTKGSKAPSYDGINAAYTSQQGVESDLGNYSYRVNPDGSITKVFESSDADKRRNALINQGLGGMSLDTTDTQNAYYNQATRLLNDRFDKERADTDEMLINRGIQTGTKQYNDVMKNLTDSQNGTLQDIANQSVYMGQQNLGQQISNVNSLGAGRDINTLMGINGGSNTAAQDNYYSEIYKNYDRDQRNARKMQLLWETPASGFKSGVSGFFSDKRLKENLKKVGSLANGLNVYVGNYKKETGLDTRPQLFLLAQEVKEKHPEAVGKRFGALTVDYSKAVK
jgi:hypothetical protein